jgi:nucleotide-binding universal stress UspA family protein
VQKLDDIRISPWSWPKLQPDPDRKGVVAFGVGHCTTVQGLARLATIFANHFAAEPMSVRVVPEEKGEIDQNQLFASEEKESEAMGFPLTRNLIRSDDVAYGITEAVTWNDTRCLLLGYPVAGSIQSFERVVEEVARQAECAVVVVRFHGTLNTRRILVPFISMDQLEEVSAFVNALASIGEHSITLLRLLPSDHSKEHLRRKQQEMEDWLQFYSYACKRCTCRIVSSDARQESIHEAAQEHDLVVMSASNRSPVRRLIFGSLAESVAKDCKKTILIVHYPD